MVAGMKTFSRRAALLLWFAAAAGAAAAGAAAAGGAGTPSLAIRGYDPVAYFTLQRATPGDAKLTVEWDEHVWQFSNARHRDLFKADPVKYAPQFTNFCAIALARGEVKEANPEYWLISDGRLYLFGKPFGPDLFRQQLGENIERANHNRALLKKPVN